MQPGRGMQPRRGCMLLASLLMHAARLSAKATHMQSGLPLCSQHGSGSLFRV